MQSCPLLRMKSFWASQVVKGTTFFRYYCKVAKYLVKVNNLRDIVMKLNQFLSLMDSIREVMENDDVDIVVVGKDGCGGRIGKSDL